MDNRFANHERTSGEPGGVRDDFGATGADLPNLGELETEIMHVVWDKGQASVQDVLEALRPRRELAYTTVMTVMSRLAQKGYLVRRKSGRSFLYEPAKSRERVARAMLHQVVDRLFRGAADKAIAHLLDTSEEVDDAELERLEALIRAKKEERRR